MVESEGNRIRECVRACRYEEALSISLESSRSEINRAHIRLLSRYRECPGIRELLNHAKSRVTKESDLAKGRRLTRIGRKAEALKYLAKALAKGGDADDCLLAGQTFAQEWRLREALDYFERATGLRGDATDYLWLGTTLEQLGRHEQALAAFERAVKLRGEVDDYRSVGNLLLKMQRFVDAREYLEKAVSLGNDTASRISMQALKARRLRMRFRYVLSKATGFWQKIKKRPIVWFAVGVATMSGILAVLIS